MTWTKLDDGFWSNPKIEAAGNEAAGAYARMLSYCGMHRTDGRVPERIAKFIARPALLKRMAEYSLLVQNGSGYVIPDYLEFNPSAEQVEERRAKRAAAGHIGGLASAKTRSKGSSKR